MATASALRPRSSMWHTRATWSAREDRLPSVVWLGLLWIGLLAGFGVDISRFAHEAPPAPGIIYVHGVVFTGWMLLLTAQVLLVAGDRVALHRRLGWFTAGWAVLMLVLGPWAAMASQSLVINGPEYDPPFLSVQMGDILAFVVFVAWGVALRKNPAAHKRIMILSTIALIDAGFGRFTGWIWPANPKSMVVWYLWECYGNLLMLGVMAGWDWWRGRLMKQFAVGAVALFSLECLEDFLYHWAPWKAFTTGVIAAWVRHFR